MTEQTETPNLEKMLADSKAEAVALRRQIATMESERPDDAITELLEQREVNRKLAKQAGESAVKTQLREAAETLNMDCTILQLYEHELRADVAPDGTVTVTPNPVEFLAKRAQTDPLLQKAALQGSARVVARKTLLSIIDNPTDAAIENLSVAEAEQVLSHLDRKPKAKGRFIKANQGAYLRLAQQVSYAQTKKRIG